MELNLERPLLFFDIESTGLNIVTDSIIELSFVKIFPGGEQRIKTWRVRPWDYATGKQKPNNPSAQKVHGITDEELSECPRFFEIVDEVISWIEGSDLGGYNSNKFDLPMLVEEIERVRRFRKKTINIDLHNVKMVDVQAIYFKMEPRNLKAAYRYYCNADLENAHSAEADTVATYEVLKAQLDRYPSELKNDVDFLAGFPERNAVVDFAGRLAPGSDGEPIITFGKHKGKTARQVFNEEPTYFKWIQEGDFALDTKRQFELLAEKFKAERREEKRQKDIRDSRPLSDKEIWDAYGMLNDKFQGGTGSLF